MRKIIRKVFWAWDQDKEEEWLNRMAANGLSLISVGFISYEFEETLPGEYKIRKQFMEHFRSHPETEKYIRFLEETGIQHVGTYTFHNYFRKKTSDGEFELISDLNSRIKNLTILWRVRAMGNPTDMTRETIIPMILPAGTLGITVLSNIIYYLLFRVPHVPCHRTLDTFNHKSVVLP